MNIPISPLKPTVVVYPDSDGMPMSDNTLQFEWITTIKLGLDDVFRDRPDVFVAGDLLWYPVEGKPDVRTAPDVLVAFGRPGGYRSSYKQWEEGGIPPQVVFEVLSPGNSLHEMVRKLRFYEQYGVEEYYSYDPDHQSLEVWGRRPDGGLDLVEYGKEWISPRLGVKFDMGTGDLRLIRPDGRPFETYLELARRAEQVEQRADLAEQRAARLAAKLRELGIDPDTLSG
jgi:Uma2 family endonuclease